MDCGSPGPHNSTAARTAGVAGARVDGGSDNSSDGRRPGGEENDGRRGRRRSMAAASVGAGEDEAGEASAHGDKENKEKVKKGERKRECTRRRGCRSGSSFLLPFLARFPLARPRATDDGAPTAGDDRTRQVYPLLSFLLSVSRSLSLYTVDAAVISRDREGRVRPVAVVQDATRGPASASAIGCGHLHGRRRRSEGEVEEHGQVMVIRPSSTSARRV